MRAEPRQDADSVLRAVGDFSTHVVRRHVDLVRVSSALCQARISHWPHLGRSCGVDDARARRHTAADRTRSAG
jgi:hypothetical protein